MPTVAAAKPGPQASLWAPITRYRSTTTEGKLIDQLFLQLKLSKPGQLGLTWINNAFDDSKHVRDLLLGQDVVDLHSDNVVLASQCVEAVPPNRDDRTTQLPGI